MNILTFQSVSLKVAGHVILDNVTWQMQTQARLALVGRNGAGKSTLLKLLQGQIAPDSGQIHTNNNLRVAGLTQDVPIEEHESVYHYLVKGLGDVGRYLAEFHVLSQTGDDLHALSICQQKLDDLHAWDLMPRVETMASRLKLNVNDMMHQLSGGMKRRVLLAAALIAEPDLLLLDEPTNHLDLESIEWLESYLKNYSGSLLLVTHDRTFLQQVANQIVEIDRGQLYRYDCDYESYLDRREAMRLSEDRRDALFDKRLADEEAWIRTGVKARRTRNEGRVRALEAMRAAHLARRAQAGKAKAIQLDVGRSGQLVIDAKNVHHEFDGNVLVDDFSCLVLKGDKIGIIGPNGCGKTTLVRLLLGDLTPMSGEVRLGTSLQVAYFDQLRRQLDEQKTVMDNVADGASHVIINGQSKHVATYLREFLFTPEQFNCAVSTLSGGEKNRLMLAKLLAKPVNLLVMDEPTNDLDIETLELLETLLVNYPGTLILISHDRSFVNQVVDTVWVYEDKNYSMHVGGYDAYLRIKKQTKPQPKEVTKNAIPPKRQERVLLSYSEQKELAALPKMIEQLELKLKKTHDSMLLPDFYHKPSDVLVVFNQELAKLESELAALYHRWTLLEDKKTS